jgi:hypothetical protein
MNVTLFTNNEDKLIYYAPLNSTFIFGELLGSNNTLGVYEADDLEVVAGRGRIVSPRTYYPGNGYAPQEISSTKAVNICDSFYFQLGLSSLKWAHSWGFLLLDATTLPILLMCLAIPFRLYLMTVLIPFCGTIVCLVQIHEDDKFYSAALKEMMEQNSYLHFEVFASYKFAGQRIAGYVLLVLAIYVSCIVSALSHEKYHRSLFTVHIALREKRTILLESADMTKYRYIMQRNRDQLASR